MNSMKEKKLHNNYICPVNYEKIVSKKVFSLLRNQKIICKVH